MEWKVKGFNELELEELYEIVKARYEVFACEQKIFEENDLDDIDKSVKHIFLEDNKKVVAYARIIKSGIKGKHATIGRVLVIREYRRKGIASELMKRAIQTLKDMDEKEIIISAQIYAKGLYEQVGFKQISESYNDVNIPHIDMKFIK